MRKGVRLSLNNFVIFQYSIAEVIPLDEDYDGGDNRVAELIGAGETENDGIELRGTDAKIRGSGKIRIGKRPQLQIQIDDGRYGEMSDTRNTKFKDNNNRFAGIRGNQQQFERDNQQQQYDEAEQTTEVPSPRLRRPESHKKKHPLRPTRAELAEAAFWRALGLGFPLNIFGLGLGGYGALGNRNFGLFF